MPEGGAAITVGDYLLTSAASRRRSRTRRRPGDKVAMESSTRPRLESFALIAPSHLPVVLTSRQAAADPTLGNAPSSARAAHLDGRVDLPKGEVAPGSRRDWLRTAASPARQARPSTLVDAARQYLDDISTFPLLSPIEEVHLAERMAAGRAAATRIAQPESNRSRLQLRVLRAAVTDGLEARDQMIHANLRLVVSIARQHVRQGLPFLDLVQEGNLGLIHAVENFDHRVGYRFSTYATWGIRQSIRRAVANKSRIIRLPVHFLTRLNRLRRTAGPPRKGMLRESAALETVQALGTYWSGSAIRELTAILTAEPPLSLDMPTGDSGDGLFGDHLADKTIGSPEARAETVLLSEWVQANVNRLPAQEAMVVTLRYGIGRRHDHTLAEIGRALGLTRERIRQIEAAALAKLRKQLAADGDVVAALL